MWDAEPGGLPDPVPNVKIRAQRHELQGCAGKREPKRCRSSLHYRSPLLCLPLMRHTSEQPAGRYDAAWPDRVRITPATQSQGVEGTFGLAAMVHTPDWPNNAQVTPWDGKSDGEFVYQDSGRNGAL